MVRECYHNVAILVGVESLDDERVTQGSATEVAVYSIVPFFSGSRVHQLHHKKRDNR